MATRYLGFQDSQDTESERKVWVLNKSLHFTEDGKVLEPEQSPFIWLADITRGRPALTTFPPIVTGN